jgi:hypothetical protein
MSFLVVPHQVSDTAATIRVGALNEENVSQRSVRLAVEGGNEERTIELDTCGSPYGKFMRWWSTGR